MGVKVVGVPTDFGANRRGVDMGASAIRYAGLLPALRKLGLEVEDLGDINVRVVRDKIESGDFSKPLVDICSRLAGRVREMVNNEDIPLVLGGDHSIALGTLQGVSQAKNLGVIWFDAHGDFNTLATSPTGNLHGMVLAAALGQGGDVLSSYSASLEAKKTVLIGVRDLDPPEKSRLRDSEVTVFTMDDIDKLGINEVMTQALEVVTSDTEGIHVSLDLDVVDPMEAPGVGTSVKGGLNYREAHLAMERVAEINFLTSLDVVEVNPILDTRNQTARLAVELIKSLLGEKIL